MAQNIFTEEDVVGWLRDWREFASETKDGKCLRFLAMPSVGLSKVAYKVTHGNDTIVVGYNFDEAYSAYQDIKLYDSETAVHTESKTQTYECLYSGWEPTTHKKPQ